MATKAKTTTEAKVVEAAAEDKKVTTEAVAETKTAAKKAPAKKAATAKKAPAKKAAEKTEAAAEAPAKKKTTRKPAKTVILQYLGQEIDEAELTERAIAQFAATEGAVSVKKITIYLKPEEAAAYYVINDQYTGRVEF